MIRILFYCLLLSPGLLIAQPSDFISIEKTTINDYKIASTGFYDGKSLWGFMNGGADLYLEYGFEGLLVQEIKFKGETIKCEIYRMADALSAFGIFSVQRHNCNTISGFKSIHCFNNYQVQIVKGNYYLSIINQTGTTSAQIASAEIGKQLDSLIANKEVGFPDHQFFKDKSSKLIYLKGEISLSNVYPQALSYLDDVSGYNMWLLPSENKKSPKVSIIQFRSAAELKQYAEFAFTGITFETIAAKKLKNGTLLMARKLGEITILQAEGNINKEMKKILKFDGIK